jgi:hypothetical protein
MSNIIYFFSRLFSSKKNNKIVKSKFQKNGVSLTCPHGWKITDEENFDDEGYYLSIEKNGFNSSGLITISWYYEILELENVMNVALEELRNSFIHKNSNLKLGDLHENKYNCIDTAAVKFNMSIIGLKHQGTIHVFHKEGKTFCINKQEAIEDKEKNKEGFKIIEQSFVVFK